MSKRRHWQKPIGSQLNPCLNCAPINNTFDLDWPLCTGFGWVQVKCGNKTIWSGDDEDITLRRFEEQAKKSKKGGWRLLWDTPLYNAEYERQGKNGWVLVKKGLGFA